ncbi:hypothetical protein AWF46_21945 [Escherichia coli]|nr:hypothetical protein AWF46_21945 [Escherichia coli]KUV99688.1 hypothetical protein AWF54_03200 [Escherichia coli]KUW02987.1 hypothetical protein AWF54_27325 [Escherichia coli]
MVGETEQVDTVSGVDAVSSIGDDVVDLIAQVDLVTTAVGPVVLERIAPAIAKGLVKRKEQGNESPLNIITNAADGIDARNGIYLLGFTNHMNLIAMTGIQGIKHHLIYIGKRQLDTCVCQQFTDKATTDITCAKM